jgi:hypothetical protein
MRPNPRSETSQCDQHNGVVPGSQPIWRFVMRLLLDLTSKDSYFRPVAHHATMALMLVPEDLEFASGRRLAAGMSGIADSLHPIRRLSTFSSGHCSRPHCPIDSLPTSPFRCKKRLYHLSGSLFTVRRVLFCYCLTEVDVNRPACVSWCFSLFFGVLFADCSYVCSHFSALKGWPPFAANAGALRLGACAS